MVLLALISPQVCDLGCSLLVFIFVFVLIEKVCDRFDAEGNEVIGLRFFTLLESCVGQVGLASLDSLLAKIVSISLENMLNSFDILLDSKFPEEMQKLDKILGPPASISLLGLPSYNNMVHMYSTAWELLVDKCAIIGQLQLLRSLVNFRLKSKNKGNSVAIADAFISAISTQRDKLVEVKENKEDSSKNLLLKALNQQKKLCGLICPFDTIYISKKAPNYLSRIASLLSIYQMGRYVFDAHLGTLTSRSKKSQKDFSPLMIGLGTLLRQFHPSYMTQYIQFMAQYVHTMEASFVATDEPNKVAINHACEVAKAVFWLRSFCKYMGISENVVELCVAPSIIALLQF
ncbi:WASH complex subunit strumpellin [Carex littledalei]|uniref:WASH complex subunit strumpellin n=1 Tax=Carex littledalei TaxID=544730 RepID=A0A833QG09_9POAL|nr:WASH complex subunit strumpellin [Carex littledalei]